MAERGTERPVLGLIAANIHLGVGATLWSGVLAAAERHDASVICFPGGPLQPGGAPRTALYELASSDWLDGAICWTSTLRPAASEEQAELLAKRLAGLPVVSLNRALDGHQTLLLNSRGGMRQAISHLVDRHGRRRIACLRGPLANPVSRERYRAYTDALTRHRLPVDRSLVSTAPEFTPGAGAAAARVLLDARGLRPGRDFDALIACSDVLATDALQFLAGRGVRVPEDLSVVGFNDSLEAVLTDPPLTSVALPFGELGALAVETVLARLRGTRPPPGLTVSGTLVTRRSCGCRSPLVAQGESVPGHTGARAGTGNGAVAQAPGGALEELFAGCPEGQGLAAALGADLRREGASPDTPALRRPAPVMAGAEGFLDLLERLVADQVRTAGDAARLDRSLLRARDELATGESAAVAVRAERLLGQARLMVADKLHRLREQERWAERRVSRQSDELVGAVTRAEDLAGLSAALARHLPTAGVRGCRLALYEPDGTVLVVRPGAHDIRCPAPPPSAVLLPDDDRFTLVAEPLHAAGDQLGFALLDAGSGPEAARCGTFCLTLGDQLGAAVRGVRRLEAERRAREAAEHASRLRIRLLDNVTEELRAPAASILRHARREPAPDATALGLAAQDATRLLRLIDDVRDLSRSEIDALDLSRQLLDPRPLLVEAFHAVMDDAGEREPQGRLRLPARLPAVRADRDRLRQILLNLLAVAAGLTARGQLWLAAEAHPAQLVISVTGSELLLPPGEDEQLFEPFTSGLPGLRLGLAIARRLAALHGGAVTGCRGPGPAGFRLELPLPTPAEPAGPVPTVGHTVLVVTSPPPPEALDLVRRHRLRPYRPGPEENLAALTARHPPRAVVWDADDVGAQGWALVQRLGAHSALRRTPFLCYGAVKGGDLAGAVAALRPAGLADPALVVAGAESVRRQLSRLVTAALPGRLVRTAADGATAVTLFDERAPGVLVVCRILPDLTAFDLLEQLRDRTGRSAVPVLVLSDQGFTAADAGRAEPYPGALLLGQDILTDAETARLLATMADPADPVCRRSGAVRHAVAYLERHYRYSFSRWQVAEAAGVSGDHLGRLFHREIGLTMWEYLTRLRIRQAKERLRNSDDCVRTVARTVGFRDRAYFSRVFRKLTGVTPHAYREVASQQ